MTSNEILKADILDILFDNRNKQYGAYALRKNYNHRLGIALGVSLSSVLILFFLMRVDGTGSHSPALPDKGTVTLTTVDLPKIKIPELPLPKKLNPPPRVRTEKFMTFEIKRDVNTSVPDQNALSTNMISNIKMDGVIPTGIALVPTPEVRNEVKEHPKTNAGFDPVEREPEFPGGAKAWLIFLQKNLIAPEQLEPGDKKMVSIRFHVSAEGTVTNFEIIQSAGKVFDNEVIRVLKKMPKWKPAIQNGQPVSRAFSQPVTFVGIEQ